MVSTLIQVLNPSTDEYALNDKSVKRLVAVNEGV